MTDQNFEAMSRAQLRSYLNSHRDDSQAWEVFFAKLNENRASDRGLWYPAPLDEESVKITEAAIKQRIEEIESSRS